MTRLIAFDHALLRVPLLSLRTYMRVGAPDAGRRARLATLFREPPAADALAYMAPGFFARVRSRLANDTLTREDEDVLANYLARLCLRSTPLGWSATASALPTRPGPLPEVPKPTDVRGVAACDEGLAASRLASLVGEPEGLEAPVSVNDTLRPVDGWYEYTKLGLPEGDVGAVLSRVRRSEHLDWVLAHAQGTSSGLELAAAMESAFAGSNLSSQDIRGYLCDLLRMQVLTIDGLLLMGPGSNSWRFLADRSEDARTLVEACNAMRVPDGSTAEYVSKGDSQARRLPVHICAWRDLPSGAGLPSPLLAAMARVLEATLAACPSEPASAGIDVGWWERVHGDADVPLHDAAAWFARSMASPHTQVGSVIGALPTRRAQDVHATRPGPGRSIAPSEPPKPVRLLSCELTKGARPLAHITDIVGWFRMWDADGRTVLELLGISPNATGRLLGRFARDDKRLLSDLRSFHRSLGDENTVVADVVFHPRDRVANVMVRKAVTDFEIVVRCGGTGEAQVIRLDDLYVCLRAGRVALRSRALSKWVRIRLGAANNTGRDADLPLFRFLATFSEPTPVRMDLFPAQVHPNAIALPELFIDDVLVQRRAWRLGRFIGELHPARGASSLPKGWLVDTRQRLRLPRWISSGARDMVSVIDLDDPSAERALALAISCHPDLVVEDAGIEGGVPALGDSEDRYVHELLVPFRWKDSFASELKFPASLSTTGDLKEVFRARDWLYACVYAPPRAQNSLVRRFHREVVAPLREQGSIDQWHFVRFGDPEGEHLRLRMRASSPSTRCASLAVLDEAMQSWLSDGSVDQVVHRSYAPEVNRYGGAATLELAFAVFTADAELAVAALSPSNACSTEDVITSVDAMLQAFGLDALGARLQFAREHAAAFAREYEVADSHRAETMRLAKRLWREGLDLGSTGQGCDGPRHLMSRCRDLAARLRIDQVPEVAGSVIHMHFNRMISGAPRSQEAIYWDLIRRLYEMAAAIRPRSGALVGQSDCV